MKPQTLEEALALVPQYIILQPGAEWREEDEELKQSTLGSRWIEPFTIRDAMLSYLKVEPHQIGRRRIPQDVRESEAWWMLFNELAEIPPHGASGSIMELERGITDFNDIRLCIHQVRGLFYGHSRRFRTKDDAESAIEILGGQNRIIKELEKGPGAFSRWLVKSNG